MTAARCGDIIDKTLQTLQSTGDGDDSRWTRDEIFGYLNEGQARLRRHRSASGAS